MLNSDTMSRRTLLFAPPAHASNTRLSRLPHNLQPELVKASCDYASAYLYLPRSEVSYAKWRLGGHAERLPALGSHVAQTTPAPAPRSHWCLVCDV